MQRTMTGRCQSGADGHLLIHVSVLSATLPPRKHESRRHGRRLPSRSQSLAGVAGSTTIPMLGRLVLVMAFARFFPLGVGAVITLV